MITDVPHPTEFKSNGIAFLNLAWESILGLCINLSEVLDALVEDNEDWTDTEAEKELNEYSRDYWRQNAQELAAGVALAQQGTEFLLKWKISIVSPYLLLAGDTSSKWPGCDKSFADFKTIDAQDLIRIHDTVNKTSLPIQFKEQFERFRKLRNTVMHSVDKRQNISAKDVLLSVLETSNGLMGPHSWPGVRQQYYACRQGVLQRHYYHYTDDQLPRETWHVLELLEPTEIKRFFDYTPKQRCYYCPSCASDCSDIGLTFKIAQLKPKSATSTNLFCVACGRDNTIERSCCSEKDCRGNVIDPESERCLSCNSRQHE